MDMGFLKRTELSVDTRVALRTFGKDGDLFWASEGTPVTGRITQVDPEGIYVEGILITWSDACAPPAVQDASYGYAVQIIE